MYQDNGTMGIMITDEDNYETIKEKFIEMYTTQCNGNASCLAQYQAFVFSKQSETTLSDSAYTQEMNFDLETGTTSTPKVSINSLDLSQATNLTTIEDKAFSNAGLTSVQFGDNSNVKTIGNRAFENNKQLKSVSIPASMETIGNYAFSASGIETLTLETKSSTQNQLNKYNKYSVSRMGSSITKLASQTTALKSIGDSAFQSNSIDSLTLPEGIETIGSGAFSNNGMQGRIIFPSTLTTIGPHAFSSNEISNIDIPASLTTIGNYAFAYNRITQLEIPKTVTNISEYTFLENPIETLTIGRCTVDFCVYNSFGIQVKTLVIESGEIGTMAFFSYDDSTTKLENLSLGEGVTAIGDSAFSQNSLTSIVLPNSLISIGYQAFMSNALTTITLKAGSLTSIGDDAFAQQHDNDWNCVLESIIIERTESDFLANVSVGSGWDSSKVKYK